jgi:DNA helicase II / ATP-dependent DNA helicase PcrA
LLTYHRAKGLEFEAVFLPRLQEGELPFRRSKSAEAVAEERRLLYVGITRAKRYLFITWITGKTRPSRFLRELAGGNPGDNVTDVQRAHDLFVPALGALKTWRLQRAKTDGVPAYVVFHDRTLQEIALQLPRSATELGGIPGVGPSKLTRYGSALLNVLAAVRVRNQSLQANLTGSK